MQYIQRVKILKLGNSVGDRFYLLHAKIKSKLQLRFECNNMEIALYFLFSNIYLI